MKPVTLNLLPAWRVILCATLPAALGLASAARAAERAIDKEVVVRATLDQAWAAWTTREGIVSFFAPDAMRFLALQPKQMISFGWNAPPSLPELRAQRTFVVVRFHAVDAATTRVTLHHTGWGTGGGWDRAHRYFDRAWGGVLGNLQKRSEQGPIDWTTVSPVSVVPSTDEARSTSASGIHA